MVDISSLIKSIDRYKVQKLKNIILNDNPKEIYSKIKNYISKYKNIEDESLELMDESIDCTEEVMIPTFDKIDVSIVIPVYNQWRFTYNCIRSIIKNTKNVTYEIILADDVSTDETIFAKEIIKNIVISRNEKNLKFLLNCNKAAKLAKGEYILFLNNDTQVQENWLYPMVELMQRDAKIGMTGSMLVYPNGRLQEAGGILWKDGSAWNYGNRDNRHKAEYNYVKEVDYISGASIMIRKSLWEQIGGFDERYVPAYCEDSDLAFEVRKAGYKVVYQPASVVIHFEGVSNGTDLSSGVKQYQIENQRKFYDKWKYVLDKEHFPNGENLLWSRDRTGNKKTIVLIDHLVPEFDKDAGSRTSFQYMKLLLEMGLHVVFVPDNFYPTEPYTSILRQMGVNVLAGNDWNKEKFENMVKDNDYKFQYFFFHRPNITEKYIETIIKKTTARILYYDVDLHFLRMERENSVKSSTYSVDEIAKWKSLEYKIFNLSDVVYTAGEYEAKFLSKNVNNINVRSLPIYLYNKENLRIKDKSFRKNRKGLLFVGGFNHIPNGDAVKWFVKDIYPLILDKIPDIHFYIVGSNPSQDILDLQCHNITVTGFVTDDELEKYYRKTCVDIVPLRFGAGVKGKVIEGLYYGLPIVTTDIGAEGIPNIEEAVKIASSPKEYADFVIELVNNGDEWLRQSNAGIKVLEECFTVDYAKSFLREDLLLNE